MKVQRIVVFCIIMLKCLLFGNYKKQYLFEKRDFFDKGGFFSLGIGPDELGFLEKKFFEKI